MKDWRIIVDGGLPGVRNMEIDSTLLSSLEASEFPQTVVRLYSWKQPTVSIGRHQVPARAVDILVCAELGVPIVSRPTGGRAVLHDVELTYAVVSNDQSRFPIAGLQPTYLAVARILAAGLLKLGICCELAPGIRETASSFRADVKNPCFASASRHELLVAGRKIVGSAQRRLRRSFLQHGSIPLQLDYGRMARILGSPPTLLRNSMTCIEEAAARPVSLQELTEAMRSAFHEHFES